MRMVTITRVETATDGVHAKIRKDLDADEYVVQFTAHGCRLDADYYTDCKSDAIATARRELQFMGYTVKDQD